MRFTRNCPECDRVIVYPRIELRDYYTGRSCPQCNRSAAKHVLYKEVKRLARGNPWAKRHAKRRETRNQSIKRYRKYIECIINRIDDSRKRQYYGKK